MPGFRWIKAATLACMGVLPAIHSVAESQPEGAHSPAMANVPGGNYQSPFKSDGTVRREWVKPFRMDAKLVSSADFLAFVREHPRWSRSRVKRLFADTTYLASWSGDDQPPAQNLENPVTQVSWYAAKEYCSTQGKRLPTTAEWERVALQVPEGMDSTAYFSRVLEWYSRPAPSSASPTDSLGSRNAFGIRDLFGRVWEWTADFNASGPADRGEVSAKDASFFCGGAAGAAAPGADYATFMRYAFRSSLKPEFALKTLGFRCAKDS